MTPVLALVFSFVAVASGSQLRRPPKLDGTAVNELHTARDHEEPVDNKGLLSDALKSLDAQVGALEQHVADMQSQGEDELKKLSESHNAQLELRSHEIQGLNELNRKLDAELFLAEKKVRKLRRDAARLQSANGELRKTIGGLRQNVSTAAMIATDTVRKAYEMRASAENTLKDLEANISNATEMTPKSLAMLLQTGGDENRAAEAAHQLSATLDAVVADHNSTAASLTKAFEKRLAVLTARKDAGLQKQAEIQAKLNQTTAVGDKLSAAVDYLMTVNGRLQATRNELLFHLATLGAAPRGRAASLLQVAAEPLAAPGAEELDAAESSVNEKVQELEASVQAMRERQQEQLDAKRREHAARIEAQTVNVNAQEKINEAVTYQIARLEYSISSLRAEADDLEASNAKLRKDIATLKVNVSTAMEFIALSLNSTAAMAKNTTELQILTELDAEDQHRNEESSHSDRLAEIQAAAATSLLQVSSRPRHKKAARPKISVETLNVSLEAMATDHMITQEKLEVSFNDSMEEFASRLAKVLREQVELNATRAAKEELEAKLKAAVNYLSQQRGSLLAAKRSLVAYIGRIHDALPAAKAVSKPELALVAESSSPSKTHKAAARKTQKTAASKTQRATHSEKQKAAPSETEKAAPRLSKFGSFLSGFLG